jgi:hypothetical protein
VAHHEFGGNSGLFVWCPESAFTDLPKGTLPRSGIEVQVLDLGYEEQWLKSKGKRSDWFTSHGDVFPVGASTMTAFSPTLTYEEAGAKWTVGDAKSSAQLPDAAADAPRGREWNHYYIRAIERRGAAVGQRRGGERRHAAAHRRRGSWRSRPKAPRSSTATCACASCRRPVPPMPPRRGHGGHVARTEAATRR